MKSFFSTAAFFTIAILLYGLGPPAIRWITVHAAGHGMQWATGIALFAGALMLLASANVLRTGLRSASWPHVEGRVISSRVLKTGGGMDRDHLGTKGGGWSYQRASYRAEISYAYEVHGHRYVGYRVALMGSGDSAQSVAARYRVDGPVLVYYDPKKPSAALLETGVPPGIFLLALFAIGFIALAWKLAPSKGP